MDNSVIFVRLSGHKHQDIFPRENRPPFDFLQTKQILWHKGIDAALIDQQVQPLSVDELVYKCYLHNPKVVCVSCISTEIFEFKKIFRLLKSNDPEIITIAVGHLATYCMDHACSEIGIHTDFFIRGEFQFVLADFLVKLELEHWDVSNIDLGDSIFSKNAKAVSKLHIIDNVNKIPDVNYTKSMFKLYTNLIPIPVFKNVVWGRVFSSYGCPNNCVFCTQVVRDTYGKVYRTRDVKRVVNEMVSQKAIGANVIEFADDNFTAVRKHVEAVCNAIIKSKLKVPWGGHARVDDLDYDLLQLMKRSGCIFIRCGVESGSENVICKMRKTKAPMAWIKQARNVFNWSKKLNIMTVANFVLGTPCETLSDLKHTRDLIFELEPDVLQLHSFCAYPGSDAYSEFRDLFLEDSLSSMCHHNSFEFCEEEVALNAQKMQKKILLDFHLRPSYVFKHLCKYGFYYLFNLNKVKPIIKSVFRIYKFSRD